MLKKRIKNILSCALLSVICIIIGYTIWIPENNADNKDSPLAVMLEQDDGTYQLSSSNALTGLGKYVFNASKSSCVNGSTISFENGKFSIIATGTDKCTVYYDKMSASFTISSVTVDGTTVTTFPMTSSYTVTPTCSGATSSWNYSTWSLDITSVSSASASCSLAFTTQSNPTTYLNQYIIDNAGTTQGASSDEGQIVNENGYRYEGSNPYNYVLYNNELWRIIGVFETTLSDGSTTQNLTKIIRNESIGGYAFNKSNANYWVNTSGTRASLNILLNDYYYTATDGTSSDSCYFYSTTVTRNCDYTETGLQTVYRNMVENVTWYLSGYTSATNPNDMYTYERSGEYNYSSNADSSTGYIGLMYPSDYGYSVLSSSCARTTNLSTYNAATCAGKAWMLQNGYEWTISPNSSDSNYVWLVDSRGYVGGSSANNGSGTRPVLYLKSNTYIVSGDGSISNPYIINSSSDDYRISFTIQTEFDTYLLFVTNDNCTFEHFINSDYNTIGLQMDGEKVYFGESIYLYHDSSYENPVLYYEYVENSTYYGVYEPQE